MLDICALFKIKNLLLLTDISLFTTCIGHIMLRQTLHNFTGKIYSVVWKLSAISLDFLIIFKQCCQVYMHLWTIIFNEILIDNVLDQSICPSCRRQNVNEHSCTWWICMIGNVAINEGNYGHFISRLMNNITCKVWCSLILE